MPPSHPSSSFLQSCSNAAQAQRVKEPMGINKGGMSPMDFHTFSPKPPEVQKFFHF